MERSVFGGGTSWGRARNAGRLAVVIALCVGLLLLDGSPAPAEATDGVVGSRTYANVQLKEGDDILPPNKDHPENPGGQATKKMLWDTGSPVTIFSRADAKQLGLLKGNGTDNGFAVGEAQIGGATGGGVKMYVSKELTICAKGKKPDGTDYDKTAQCVKNKKVLYPKPGEPDIPKSLLGTNFGDQLVNTAVTTQKGTVSFFDPLLATPENPDGKKCDKVVPTEPEEETPPPGGHKRHDAGGTIMPIPPLYPPWWPFPPELGPIYPFVVGTGSPYTIIGNALAAELSPLEIVGEVDLFNEDPDTFNALFADGFFDDFDPGPFNVAALSISIPATSPGSDELYGTADDTSTAINYYAPVLVNPFDTDKNLLGTNVLYTGDSAQTTFDLAGHLICYIWPRGGIAEPADTATSSLETADSPSGSSPPYAAIAGAAAAAALALTAGGWYARRRWLR